MTILHYGANRLAELRNGANYKKKKKTDIIRDKCFATLVLKHSTGAITLTEYHSKVLKLNQDYDLPLSHQKTIKKLFQPETE